MELQCFAYLAEPPPLRAAKVKRDWMDTHTAQHPYRCLPLNIANTLGWDILLPFDLEIAWNGGAAKEDLTVRAMDGFERIDDHVHSNFGCGVVTFLTGFIFRTAPDWQLLVMGPPNIFLDGLAPMTGVVETSWLPYPFTMNWRMTGPGTVRVPKGTPFCRILPIQIGPIEASRPEIRLIDDDRELSKAHRAFARSRDRFKDAWKRGEYKGKQAWQRFYFSGSCPHVDAPPGQHRQRLRVHEPADRRNVVELGRNNDILIVEDALPTQHCDELIRAFQAAEKPENSDPFYSGRVVYAEHLPRSIMDRIRSLMVDQVRTFFRIDGALRDEGLHVIVWPKGTEMPPHADAEHPDGSPHRTPWREFAAIVYLNDDFNGGELWFPDLDIEIRPKKGMLVVFPGNGDHYHGIAPIRGGDRYTALCWLTRQPV